MRDIKYRAWDKLSKEMRDATCIDFANNLGWNVRVGVNNFRSFDEVELMQYTGLKDRNGKEVYESDILKLYDGSAYQIYYNIDIGSYALLGLYDRDTLGDKLSDWDAYVVGNIYESPELLK